MQCEAPDPSHGRALKLVPLVSLQGQGEGEAEGAKGRGFLCTFCGTHIRRSDNYHRHMRKHSGETRFLCTVCLKPFSRSDALNAHMAKRHPSHKDGISSWGHAEEWTHSYAREMIYFFSSLCFYPYFFFCTKQIAEFFCFMCTYVIYF